MTSRRNAAGRDDDSPARGNGPTGRKLSRRRHGRAPSNPVTIANHDVTCCNGHGAARRASRWSSDRARHTSRKFSRRRSRRTTVTSRRISLRRSSPSPRARRRRSARRSRSIFAAYRDVPEPDRRGGTPTANCSTRQGFLCWFRALQTQRETRRTPARNGRLARRDAGRRVDLAAQTSKRSRERRRSGCRCRTSRASRSKSASRVSTLATQTRADARRRRRRRAPAWVHSASSAGGELEQALVNTLGPPQPTIAPGAALRSARGARDACRLDHPRRRARMGRADGRRRQARRLDRCSEAIRRGSALRSRPRGPPDPPQQT